nr:MAG TPA: NS2 peptide, GBVB, VIRAL PROTEIN [Bacteriophage sp.]
MYILQIPPFGGSLALFMYSRFGFLYLLCWLLFALKSN